MKDDGFLVLPNYLSSFTLLFVYFFQPYNSNKSYAPELVRPHCGMININNELDIVRSY